MAGFGVSILVFALSTSFWLSVIALFFSGVADGLSMVIRRLTVRMFSPEQMRGRIGSVNSIFIGASNEIGAFESGVMASIFGVVPSVVIGAIVTLGVVGAVTTAGATAALDGSAHPVRCRWGSFRRPIRTCWQRSSRCGR